MADTFVPAASPDHAYTYGVFPPCTEELNVYDAPGHPACGAVTSTSRSLAGIITLTVAV